MVYTSCVQTVMMKTILDPDQIVWELSYDTQNHGNHWLLIRIYKSIPLRLFQCMCILSTNWWCSFALRTCFLSLSQDSTDEVNMRHELLWHSGDRKVQISSFLLQHVNTVYSALGSLCCCGAMFVENICFGVLLAYWYLLLHACKVTIETCLMASSTPEVSNDKEEWLPAK